MDLNLSDKKVTSFRLFQGKILEEYDRMAKEFNFQVIDATRPIQKQQKEIRRMISSVLKGWRGLPNPVQSAREHNMREKQKLSNPEATNG
jgi:dTMP kinase